MTDTHAILNTVFPVLDKGSITLLDMMPHPSTGLSGDMTIVNAARVSFLGESKGEEKDKRLLMYLYKHKHTSPFEMVVFQWRIHAPVLVWWQWVRHRMASYSAQSGRYTEFKEDEFYIPDEWRLQSKDNKQGSEGLLDPGSSLMLTEQLIRRYKEGYEDYQMALRWGVAREQARLFLNGWGSYYTFVVKMDVHNAMHFFRLRMAGDAQSEIRDYAVTMYEKTFKPLMPWCAEAFEQA